MAAYRSGEVPDAPVMAGKADAAAYAAYRMPATAAATEAAIREMQLSLEDWRPSSLLDFGAGTGGATWAAVTALPGLRALTLLEQSADAMRLGRAVFAQAQSDLLRSARWLSWRLTGNAHALAADLPAADFAVAAYVLGELAPAEQSALVGLAVSAAPGGPAGGTACPGRAPPHPQRPGPAAGGRLPGRGPVPARTAVPAGRAGGLVSFRRPGAALSRAPAGEGRQASYEDEKFGRAWAAVRSGAGRPSLPNRPARSPARQRGTAMLDLCGSDGRTGRELVSKSMGERYRRARKSSWGDRFGEPDAAAE